MKLNSFIKNESQLKLGVDNIPIYTCEFDVNFYTDSMFDLLNIPYPEQMNSSVTKRKAEFLAGRYCAKKSLLSLGAPEFFVGINIDRSPCWPNQVCGSISHCKDIAMATTFFKSSNFTVGIDIEDVCGNLLCEDLINQIINRDELELFNKIKIEKSILFTLIFSAKESFYKAAYPSVKKIFGFQAVSIKGLDFQSQKIQFILNEPLNDNFQSGFKFEAGFSIEPNNKVFTYVIL